MRIGIAVRVAIFIGIGIALIAGSFSYLASFEAENLLIGNSINLAGKNRYLTATVLLQSEYYLSGLANRDNVEESLQNLESNILVLRDGGNLAGNDVAVLPSSLTEDWQKVHRDYVAFEAGTEHLISNPPAMVQVADQMEIRLLGNTLIASSDSLVTKLTGYANENSQRLIFLQMGLGILNIGVHLIMLWLILKSLEPIKTLTKTMKAIREGNLDISLPVHGGGELRELIEGFNSMIGTIRESTRSLLVQKEKYRQLYDDAPDLYRSINSDGILLDCNKTYVKSLGYASKGELLGRSIFETTAESSLDAMRDSLEAWTKTGSVMNREVWLKRKDGSIFPTLISATSLYDDNGRMVGSNSCIIDVTEIYGAKRRLEDANKRLKEMDAMKTEFISIASHELRTPIQPILGIARLSSRNLISQQKAWEIVTKEAERLQRLANDILDATRIEGGSIQLKTESFSINEIIRNVLYEGKLSTNDGVQLNVALAPDDELLINADKSRITQVVTNIVGNAIKFTKKGSVQISTRLADGGAFVEFLVVDTGAGIPQEILPRLFTKFATKSVSKGAEHGTGLGLFICKSIVEAHGGSIAGYNNEGGGATFKVLLPAGRFSPVKCKMEDAVA